MLLNRIRSDRPQDRTRAQVYLQPGSLNFQEALVCSRSQQSSKLHNQRPQSSMISPKSLLVGLSLCQLTWLFLPMVVVADNLQQFYRIDGSQEPEQQHNSLGHYEFEMAPMMVPPSVRKPPYLQSAQACPGSDIFAGFSPRDTLCGDLNQGRVPLNPLGQSFTDQAYPFELIKNKTLQFLARALPVLKLEYETIPKVARYLPHNHLLNPTHQMSPLRNEHLHQINRRLTGSSPQPELYLKRRKRWTRQFGSQVAEMSPNVSLVVSSAHSPGKIWSPRETLNESSLAVITKDGFRALPSLNGPSSGASVSSKQQMQQSRVQNWVSGSTVVASTTMTTEDTQRQENMAATNKNNQPSSNGNNALDSKQPGKAEQTKPSSSQSRNHASTKELDSDNLGQARSSGLDASEAKQHHQSSSKPDNKRSRVGCAESASGVSSAICQAATTLVEGTKEPAWLQLVKTLGNVYTGNTYTDSWWASGNPVWSMLSSLVQQPDSISSKSSSSQPKTSGLRSIISSLTGIPATKDSNTLSNPENKEHSPLAALGSSTMTRLAMAGWATNAIMGLIEYLAPSALQSASSTFAKRKKPFDPGETFVDTPASLAATLKQTGFPNKQPPTPCPSVEEYISPTFARNYQGAWKYVVQIPHEGYFTQTIQRTSCVRQKCEFIEGVCHESPRWVSLLVAEIYYPNAILGQQSHQANNDQVSQMLASPTSHMHQVTSLQQRQSHPPPKLIQDPLQMTDSLNIYNHNLNTAFTNAATELGLDPTNVANMQHLANAYNYQLLQRNGLLNHHHQMPTIESRSAQAPTTGQHNYNNDYIISMAAAALQQNPNMNINELISSLQLELRRKKRDLYSNQAADQRSKAQYNQQVIQQRSGNEMNPSINELSSTVSQPHQIAANQIQFNKPNIHLANAQVPSNSDHQASPQVSNVASVTNLNGNTKDGTQEGDPNGQPECDGHDKIGCYVVRVYYDWFLVNGSCKCWKTTPGTQTGSSTSTNSFLRRIFTG